MVAFAQDAASFCGDYQHSRTALVGSTAAQEQGLRCRHFVPTRTVSPEASQSDDCGDGAVERAPEGVRRVEGGAAFLGSSGVASRADGAPAKVICSRLAVWTDIYCEPTTKENHHEFNTDL